MRELDNEDDNKVFRREASTEQQQRAAGSFDTRKQLERLLALHNVSFVVLPPRPRVMISSQPRNQPLANHTPCGVSHSPAWYQQYQQIKNAIQDLSTPCGSLHFSGILPEDKLCIRNTTRRSLVGRRPTPLLVLPRSLSPHSYHSMPPLVPG